MYLHRTEFFFFFYLEKEIASDDHVIWATLTSKVHTRTVDYCLSHGSLKVETK